jgi:hypothetical protein
MRLSLALCFALVLPSFAYADGAKKKIDPAKEADIRKLLDLTGAGALGKQVKR